MVLPHTIYCRLSAPRFSTWCLYLTLSSSLKFQHQHRNQAALLLWPFQAKYKITTVHYTPAPAILYFTTEIQAQRQKTQFLHDNFTFCHTAKEPNVEWIWTSPTSVTLLLVTLAVQKIPLCGNFIWQCCKTQAMQNQVSTLNMNKPILPLLKQYFAKDNNPLSWLFILYFILDYLQ